MTIRTPRALALTAATTLALAACSPAVSEGEAGPSAEPAADGVEVLASVYPLKYVAEQVGGSEVTVSLLTPPGAEPHDLELSPKDIARVGQAGLVVYLEGFQPSVDDAVAQSAPAAVVDAAAYADLTATGDDAHEEETGSEEDHAEEGEALDPVFWLDPTRLAGLAEDVAEELSAIDPGNAEEYAANADRLTTELTALDEEFRTGLATCQTRTIVVSHEAFGYLADAYDLEQVGLAGLDPDSEPSPARLAEIGEVVEAEGVTTIFTEPLINPKVGETLARDLGVTTAVLDPLEGLVDESGDYQQVMRENLAALQDALGCR